MTWSYGVTTVPSRMTDLLPKTLHSLALAGFGNPRLFVDGAHDETDYLHFDLPITLRDPVIHVFPHWVLSAWEIYFRNPKADFYALFQDDFVTVRNLRRYIEARPYPEKGYLNLLTFQNKNEDIIKGKPPGWYEAASCSNDPKGLQGGRGAVALVFSQAAMRTYLDSGYIAKRMHEHLGRDKGGMKGGLERGYTHVDGAIVAAMNNKGWREYIHAPSLVYHLGKESTIGSGGMGQAKTFPGETFNAMEWLS